MCSGLKPCPFCGGEARIIAKPYEPKVCVGCDDDTCLGFSGLGWLYDSEKEASEAWNRRAERTCRNASDPPSGFYCSACGWGDFCEPSHLLTTACFAGSGGLNYCPNCGAKVVE